MVIFRMIAKISQIYCWGILIWATLYIFHMAYVLNLKKLSSASGFVLGLSLGLEVLSSASASASRVWPRLTSLLGILGSSLNFSRSSASRPRHTTNQLIRLLFLFIFMFIYIYVFLSLCLSLALRVRRQQKVPLYV